MLEELFGPVMASPAAWYQRPLRLVLAVLLGAAAGLALVGVAVAMAVLCVVVLLVGKLEERLHTQPSHSAETANDDQAGPEPNRDASRHHGSRRKD